MTEETPVWARFPVARGTGGSGVAGYICMAADKVAASIRALNATGHRQLANGHDTPLVKNRIAASAKLLDQYADHQRRGARNWLIAAEDMSGMPYLTREIRARAFHYCRCKTCDAVIRAADARFDDWSDDLGGGGIATGWSLVCTCGETIMMAYVSTGK